MPEKEKRATKEPVDHSVRLLVFGRRYILEAPALYGSGLSFLYSGTLVFVIAQEAWREFLTWAGPDPVLVTWSESDAAALLTQLKFLGVEQELPRQCVPLGRGQKMKECLQEMRFFCPKCQRELLVSADSIDSNDLGAGSRTQRSERAKKWKGKGQFVLRQFGRMVATRQCPQHGPVQIQAWQGRSAQGKRQPWIHSQIRCRAPGEIWWERMSQLEEPNKAAQGTAAEREAE